MQIFAFFNGKERRGRQPLFADEGFFENAVTGNGDGAGAGPDRCAGLQKFQCLGRHVFKLGGDGSTVFGHVFKRVRVEIVSLEVAVGDTAGRAARVRVKYPHPVAHAVGRHAEHAPELAAAQHAEGGIGEDHGFGGSSMFSAMSVWAARKSSSFEASSASLSASRLTA